MVINAGIPRDNVTVDTLLDNFLNYLKPEMKQVPGRGKVHHVYIISLLVSSEIIRQTETFPLPD